MDKETSAVRTIDLPQVAEDTRIAEEVVGAIAATGRFPRRLEVSASDGVVKLRGRVASYYQKQVAQVAASAVIGARQLVNEIEVG